MTIKNVSITILVLTVSTTVGLVTISREPIDRVLGQISGTSGQSPITPAPEPVPGWTEEKIAADPEGYSQYARQQLKADEKVLIDTRRDLAVFMDRLAAMLNERHKKLEFGRGLAEKLAEALVGGTYPVSLFGKSYSEDQLRMQIALVLAEISGLESSLSEINEVSKAAEEEVIRLVVGLERVTSQVAILDTRVGIYRSRATQTAGLDMIATATTALQEHRVFLRENPVRDLESLMVDVERNVATATRGAASAAQVEEFLTDFVARRTAGKGE